MPLPTSTPSTAGTTNVINNVPGTAGYTGSYTFIDPGGNYPQSAVDLSTQIKAGGIGSNTMAGGGNGKGGFGIKLPDFSGLDRALGALGAAIALGQTLMSIPNIVKGIANNFVAIGQNLKRSVQGLLDFPGQLQQAAKDAFNPDKYVFSGVNNKDWRVKLYTNFSVLGGAGNPMFKMLEETGGMVFPLTPNITVTHKAAYTTTEPIHNNFAYQGFKFSNVEDITISCEFPVNTHYEGKYWIAATTFLKSATKMFYGQSIPAGSPPIVCKLRGYGAHIFNDIPVVIKSYQVELKDNVQYKMIGASEMFSKITSDVTPVLSQDPNVTWVPTMSQITVVVSPVYNREKLRQFSLQDYAKGGMKGVL
jgi:hypothetical protein